MGSLAHVFVPRDHPRYPSLAAWSETSRRKFWKFGKSSDGWDGIWVARGVWDPDPLFHEPDRRGGCQGSERGGGMTIRPDYIMHQLPVTEWTEEEGFGHLRKTFDFACRDFPDVMEPYAVQITDIDDRQELKSFMRKALGEPTDHRLTPRVRTAIEAIVHENKPRAEAAKLAGLTDDALRKSLKNNPAAREFYASEVKALLHFAKAKAAHALINELDGPNAAARVASARHTARGERSCADRRQHASGAGLRNPDCGYASASAAGWASTGSDCCAPCRGRSAMNGA
jgi:hypothetical protein